MQPAALEAARRVFTRARGIGARTVGAPLVTLVLCVVAPLAPGAHGQEAIPTNARAADGGAPSMPMPDDTLRLDDHPGYGPGFLRPVGPCGGPLKTADGKTDKSPHGEVFAGVGTHGYREAGGVVCVPLSDSTAVTIAVDAGQLDGWGRRR